MAPVHTAPLLISLIVGLLLGLLVLGFWRTLARHDDELRLGAFWRSDDLLLAALVLGAFVLGVFITYLLL